MFFGSLSKLKGSAHNLFGEERGRSLEMFFAEKKVTLS